MTRRKLRYVETFAVMSLLESPVVDFLRRLPPTALAFEEDGTRYRAPVVFHLRFTGTPRRFNLHGRVRTRVDLQCDRCLQWFDHRLKVTFKAIYLPADQMPEGSVRIQDTHDVMTSFYHDAHLDLGDIIREQIYLHIPLKRLCHPECKGMCSHCGTNRNTSPCLCADDAIDPRWAPLARLKDALS